MTYIFYHLELLWSFVRGKNDALYGIDATRRGFWLSFMALLIVEPLSLFYALLFGYLDEVLLFRSGGGALYLLQLFLDWGLPPLILYVLISGPWLSGAFHSVNRELQLAERDHGFDHHAARCVDDNAAPPAPAFYLADARHLWFCDVGGLSAL